MLASGWHGCAGVGREKINVRPGYWPWAKKQDGVRAQRPIDRSARTISLTRKVVYRVTLLAGDFKVVLGQQAS